MDYTAAQRQAIETIDRNLQIIACAGSGKTQVISARIVRILQQGVPLSAVVAFTFTEKAAGELKGRIDRLARNARQQPGAGWATCSSAPSTATA